MKKKLIEVALPLEAINKASAREKSIRHGHPSTLHLWWARRPLAAARAVLFAQLVDDPSAHPDLFPTEKAQEKERQRLFRIIEDLVQWENTTNELVLGRAREEIWQSWRAACAENVDHPRAKELFNRQKLPAFHDPFSGGGAIPLEAQRLGLEAYASDLNPVAVLINKAMIEIPPKFAGKSPVNPEVRRDRSLIEREWRGAQGLAEDVRYYGDWMSTQAEKRIGHLYPQVEVTAQMARERPDLKPYVARKFSVIVWLWARTVKSPNPAFANVQVPLVASFWLSTKKGRQAWIEPVIRPDKSGYDFVVRLGGHPTLEETVNQRGGICLMSGSPMPFEHIRAEASAARMGARLMAIVAEADNNRIFLPPTEEMEIIARNVQPSDVPDTDLPKKALGLRIQKYGMTKWRDLFTPRQLVTLGTFSGLVQEARTLAKQDALKAGLSDDDCGLDQGGAGATAYADALAVYLGLTSSKAARFTTTLSTWRPDETKLSRAFTRNDIAMTWDFAETNPFSGTGGDLRGLVDGTASVLLAMPAAPPGWSWSADACSPSDASSATRVIGTDPPYYDNVPYADLSDYFYVWLRLSLRPIMPSLFSTITVPKTEELVADSIRHGSKANAEDFFVKGMTRAMRNLAKEAHPAFPVTIYYAFKQSESKDELTVSTGWETFLDAVIQAGFTIDGTWPVRTEGKTRMRSFGSNALASSIVLVCRPRTSDAITATRRDFLTALRAELPEALKHLQRGNIAPVDLAQAAIGPGMAIYTRYAKLLDAEGKPISVRDALALINQTLDQVLTEQEGDFDADSRWALAWFEQSGFDAGDFGVADVLARAKNTSVDAMKEAGVISSKSGKVRLLKPTELHEDWDPATDPRLTAWEMVHHLIRVLEASGESAAAELVAKLGRKAEVARELAYRLYTICERKKRPQEALSYNGLVQSWLEIARLSRDHATPETQQAEMFSQE
jgi:putative DNA methylase